MKGIVTAVVGALAAALAAASTSIQCTVRIVPEIKGNAIFQVSLDPDGKGSAIFGGSHHITGARLMSCPSNVFCFFHAPADLGENVAPVTFSRGNDLNQEVKGATGIECHACAVDGNEQTDDKYIVRVYFRLDSVYAKVVNVVVLGTSATLPLGLVGNVVEAYIMHGPVASRCHFTDTNNQASPSFGHDFNGLFDFFPNARSLTCSVVPA